MNNYTYKKIKRSGGIKCMVKAKEQKSQMTILNMQNNIKFYLQSHSFIL